MKKLLSALLCFALLLTIGGFALPTAAASPLKLVIDGKNVTTDVAPIVESGTTLVPVRVATESLGADVLWNAKAKTVTVRTAAHTVTFTVGARTYSVDGTIKSLTVAPKILSGRTLIPIRALSEALGAIVDYSTATRTATIKYFTTLTGSIKVSGSTTVLPIMQTVADRLLALNKELSMSVAGGGSGAGIKDSINGANNIGMSSRDLTADELSSLTPFSIANDAIAIIVNPSNPVKSLTTEQAAKIFLGEIKNWKDVGGSNAPILVQKRETGSGTLATLEELLLDKKSVTASATPYTSSALIKQAVAKEKNAIGFDSIGYVDDTVKVLALGGVAPSTATVKDRTYPLSRQLFLVTKGTPTGDAAKVIDYFRSAAVQTEVVVKEGYISLH